MRNPARLMILGASVVLAGCNAPPSPSGDMAHGRYVGIGVYSVGALWSKMTGLAAPKTVSAATIADDEHVIVVVDSRTGEVRECGDYSGVCVSLNPWTKAVSSPQNAPVALSKHLTDPTEASSPPAQPNHP